MYRYRHNNHDGWVAAIGLPLLIIVGALVNGFVLSRLWGWFFVPTFHITEISVVQAIGISMVVGFLTQHETKSDEKTDADSLAEIIAMGMAKIIIAATITFIFGWFVHLFM